MSWSKDVFLMGNFRRDHCCFLNEAAQHPKPRGSHWPEGGAVLALSKMGWEEVCKESSSFHLYPSCCAWMIVVSGN